RKRYDKIKRLKKKPGANLFYTPWNQLNRVIKFSRPEELAVLVGRPALGKTWLMIVWAYFLAQAGVRVLFVSKEMSTEAIEDRLEAIRFKLNYPEYRDGNLPKKEELRWKRESLRAKKTPMVITGKETIEGTGFTQI